MLHEQRNLIVLKFEYFRRQTFIVGALVEKLQCVETFPHVELLIKLPTRERPDIFFQRYPVSPDFRKIGARSGAHSMIIRRSGMKKILEFIKSYRIFFPYDMEMILPSDQNSDMFLYTVLEDVVSNQVDSVSDNGAPSYK